MSPFLLATITIVLGQAAQAGAGGESSAELSARRLAFMKDSAQSYEFLRDGDRTPWLTLRPDPVFRMGKQGSGNVLEGAIFLWTDEVGRPEVAAQLFLLRSADHPGGEWLHEFTSLAAGTFTAGRQGAVRWAPREPGLVFKKVPDAAKPAASPSQRSRQMRAIAEEFRAEDNFGNTRWEVLRMLATPIARYGKAGGTPEDGALFAFVEGTDPEAFLFIEARPGEGGLEWQYACAPMSCWPLKIERKGQVVWSLPFRNTEYTRDPSKPFVSLADRP